MLPNPFSWLQRGTSEERFERKLQSLHDQTSELPVHVRPREWLRLARLCTGAGHAGKSMMYHGLAIDDALLSGEYDEATRLCRMLLERNPSVVRARCTLAFLSLRKGYSSEFLADIIDYVRAARAVGDGELALARLKMMAAVTTDGAVRRFLERQSRLLGQALGLDAIDQNAWSRTPRPIILDGDDQDKRWATVLRLSIAGPTDPMELAARH
jgi:hypothetical protein